MSYLQQQPSDLQWTPLCLFHSILNDEKIVGVLSLTHSNIFKFKKTHPLCLCFLIRFSKEEAEATEDFHVSISCLFKNKIVVGNSHLFKKNAELLNLNVLPLISCLFLKITVYAQGTFICRYMICGFQLVTNDTIPYSWLFIRLI